MKNILLDKGIILPSGVISKDKINLVAGTITRPFAEMAWVTTGGVSKIPIRENRNAAFSRPLLRSRGRKSHDLRSFAGAGFDGQGINPPKSRFYCLTNPQGGYQLHFFKN